MKRVLILLALVSYTTPLVSDGLSSPIVQPTGGAATFTTRESTTLAMMGWGIGLAVGIATICALIPDDLASSHSHSH